MNKFPEEYGKYNDFPPNWKEATSDEFWSRFCTYSWDKEETRQMFRFSNGTKSGKMVQAHLFLYFDNVGLAFVYQVGGARYTTPLLYKFALCEHLNRVGIPKESYMCYHVSKCVDCGMKFSVDSSD